MNVYVHLSMLWVLQDNVRIDEVKLRRKYINSGDVFILDLGLKIFQVRPKCISQSQELYEILMKSIIATP